MIKYEFNRKCSALRSSIPLWSRGNQTLCIKGQRTNILGLQVIWCPECTWLCLSKTRFTRTGAKDSLIGSIRNANYWAPPQTFWRRNSPVWVLPRQTRKRLHPPSQGICLWRQQRISASTAEGTREPNQFEAEIPTTVAICEEQHFQQDSPPEEGWRRPSLES